ncbi:UNVERIFIED_CONTAM: hypothetical protein HDU68_010704, partial [Siphonaria sp. JEL0065]
MFTKPTTFSTAFVLVSFLIVALFKTIIFSLIDKEPYFLSATLHLPGIYFLDLALYSLYSLPLSRHLRKYQTAVFVTAMPLQTAIALLFFGYFLESRNFMDWFMFEDMDYEMMQSFSVAFRKQLLMLAAAFSTLIALKICIAFVIYRVFKKQSTKRYLPVQVGDVESSSEEEDDKSQASGTSSSSDGYRVIHYFSFRNVLLLSALSYFVVIPPFSEIARVSENFLISPVLTHVFRTVNTIFKDKDDEKAVLEDIRVDYSTGNSYPNTEEARLENVVILHMESLRSDILDFKTTGHLAKLLLDKDHIDNFDTTFSPFLNKLKHQSYFFPQARTAA